MAGRVLVVEPDEGRRAALVAALESAYLEPVAAGSAPDLIVAAAEACADPAALRTAEGGAPVMIVGPAGGAVAAFAAGADDHLSRPVQARLLSARARRLIRRRAEEVEIALRAATARELGVEPDLAAVPPDALRLLLVAPRGPESEALRAVIAALSGGEVKLAPGGFAAMRAAEVDRPDAVIVADGLERLSSGAGFAEGEDALGLIGALRARGEGAGPAVIHLSDPGAPARAAAALAAGADETAPGGPGEGEAQELGARILRELGTRRRLAALRDSVEAGLKAAAADALTDPLTGLRNRRYFDRHGERLLDRARQTGGRLALLLFDLDRFKAVNDGFGHDAGDAALRAFAQRLRGAIRGADLAARIGGEEFAVFLAGADESEARAAAERVRAATAGRPVALPCGGAITLTVSAGVAPFRPGDDLAAILRRADAGLRAAKRGGRDRVEPGGL